MKVVYHIGLHCTDEDRALRCLLRNAGELSGRGTIVPSPGRFRPVLRKAMVELRGAPAPREMQEAVLDAVMDADRAERLVFSSDSFLCVPARAVSEGVLYPQAAERAVWIRNLFPERPAEFVFALRNPATWLPALQARFAAEESFADVLARIEPERLSWPDMVRRFRDAVPGSEITVWADEDTPLIWPEVLGALSAHPAPETLEGAGDFAESLMEEDGQARMRAWLAEHPPRSPAHRRKVTAAFLDRYARAEAIEVEYDLPGWTAERVARLTERYEADLDAVARLDGVRVLSAS
jgi:limonene-1,2-epoxide hydrolase